MAAKVVTLPRRNRPGTKSDQLDSWRDVDLADMETVLAVQQYIRQTIKRDRKNLAAILELPEGQDSDLWQYEHLRQFCFELNHLIVSLQDACTALSCPQMKATDEWLYLCAAHKQPQECSAIDYAVHTLDGTSALLNSNKYFPSRVTIPPASAKHFQSIARRVYRIFAHAFFHHRDIYDQFENETSLCARFVKFSIMFDLIPANLLIIPH
eukprot:Opistho-2@12357